MEVNKKFIAKMIRFYGLIVVVSNAIAVMVPKMISIPILDAENTQKWESYLYGNHFANIATFFAFLVPTIVCIIYSKKIFKSDEKIVKNVAEIPSVFSLSSVIGWNLYYFIEIPFVIHARALFAIHIKGILISSWAFALFSGMTAWTLSYLAIEILNRVILLPKVFPEGHISRSGFSFRPSLKHLMLFCFMVTSVFPVVMLLTSYIALHINNGLVLNWGIVFVAILLLVIAFVITLSLSRLIINPLNRLTQASIRIKDGDYKSRVGIVTSDELGILADSFNDMAASLAEKEFMRDTFGKIVDPEVRDYLMKEKGGVNFTALGKCITSHHGIINKYIGDAIMAIFGAPVKSENSAKDAYEAALDMRKALLEVNRDFEKEGLPEVRFGIGIHTGPVFAGTIGAANRMEYTVIGDTVNTASRLESLCKTYKTDLLISEASASRINKETDMLTFIADAEIRGKTGTMKIYTAKK